MLFLASTVQPALTANQAARRPYLRHSAIFLVALLALLGYGHQDHAELEPAMVAGLAAFALVNVSLIRSCRIGKPTPGHHGVPH